MLPNAAETHHLPGDTGTQLSERKPILYKALGTESGDACELGVGAAPGTTGDTEDAAFSASPSLRSQQCHRFVCYTNNSSALRWSEDMNHSPQPGSADYK